MAHKITLIPGDGIGPEVTLAAKRCIEATGVKIIWDEVLAGTQAQEKTGELLPQKVLDSIKKNKVCLKGPIITPIGEGFRSVNVAIRQALDLYACVRPAKTYVGVKSLYKDIDLVIIRENSEDLYAGIEFEAGSTAARNLILDIEKYSLVHKANIMKFTDGLFLKIGREVAKEYAGKIIFEEAIVDNMSMQLVQKPHNYELLVMPNLYGDILSDLCAGLTGGLGIAPGANFGKNLAVFEAVHGSAPKYKGLNKVNPTAMILSGVLMLGYIH
ncbi:MAG: isocitrate/isopropylmalate family dehydrogenase, partial [Candidatus Omnitrophica bacterium]|nr:isocitrate/isopropylmalate family dehydrogenase [Candidatus Omnitrophota bacterium]